MRTAVFSTNPYDERFLTAANAAGAHEFIFVEDRLSARSALLAREFDAICAFVNDDLSAPVLMTLAAGGTKMIALRCAGACTRRVRAPWRQAHR